jgi:hypothetical protein
VQQEEKLAKAKEKLANAKEREQAERLKAPFQLMVERVQQEEKLAERCLRKAEQDKAEKERVQQECNLNKLCGHDKLKNDCAVRHTASPVAVLRK